MMTYPEFLATLSLVVAWKMLFIIADHLQQIVNILTRIEEREK